MSSGGYNVSVSYSGASFNGREKAAVQPTDLSPTFNSWMPWRAERNTGDWQKSIKVTEGNALSFGAVWASTTLISTDMAKMRVKLVEEDANGIKMPIESPAFSPVLRKPNRFQTWFQFIEQYMLSKLTWGNAYVLKVRDDRNIVIALYVLDPRGVRVMVAPGASVFYQVQQWDVTPIEEAVMIPASEIIHDRNSPVYGHPLIGVSPISACALAAGHGLSIQEQQTQFFKNGGRPGGVVSAPGKISDETAARIETTFKQKFAGDNVGRLLVLGDDLKYQHLTFSPKDMSLIEQLKFTEHMCTRAFRVPAYKIGIGEMPTYENGSILNQIYYSDCLQAHIESAEAVLKDGLSLPRRVHVQFVIEDLLRMDNQSLISALKEAVGAGIMSPNEARGRLNLPPVRGGETPFMQEQNWHIGDLADRRELGDLISQPAPAVIKEVEVKPVEGRSLVEQLDVKLLEDFRSEAANVRV